MNYTSIEQIETTMTTIKSYSDLQQSKKLAEILPLESADMCWFEGEPFVEAVTGYEEERAESHRQAGMEMYPCWSLVALLNAVDFSTINLHYDNARKDWTASATIHDSTKHCTKYESIRAENPVDACYEMIIKLHELNLL